MTTDKIRVTVDGEPVTCEVSLEQVRAYLTRKGWGMRDGSHGLEMWVHGRRTVWIEKAEDIRSVLRRLSYCENRSAGAVLRDIAGDTRQPWTWEGAVDGRKVEVVVDGKLVEVLHADGPMLTPYDAFDAVLEALRATVDGVPREREIPCGHKVEDLISGTDPKTGRRLVTKCGACLAERARVEAERDPDPPHEDSGALYHAHLDGCARCRERPFDLCAVGAKLLEQAATR